MRCCTGDEGLLALRSRPAGGGFKPPSAALAEDCRGERDGKGARDASGGDQEDVALNAPVTGFAVDASLLDKAASETGCYFLARDEPGGYPSTGQVVPGVEAA